MLCYHTDSLNGHWKKSNVSQSKRISEIKLDYSRVAHMGSRSNAPMNVVQVVYWEREL